MGGCLEGEKQPRYPTPYHQKIYPMAHAQRNKSSPTFAACG